MSDDTKKPTEQPRFKLCVHIDIYVDAEDQIAIVQNVLHATAATIAVTTGAPVSFDARSFERTNEPEAAPARKEASPLN
jgi:hypothetical protein